MLNVGAALSTLGAPCRVVSPVGAADLDEFRREFAELGATVEWVVSRKPTRVCTTVLDEATGSVTELVENAPAIEARELAEFRRAFEHAAAGADVVVLTGSLPAAVPETIYRELSEQTAARLVVEQIPAGPKQTEAVISVVHQWALQDLAGALAWVNRFPGGILKERAAHELAGVVYFQQIAAAP